MKKGLIAVIVVATFCLIGYYVYDTFLKEHDIETKDTKDEKDEKPVLGNLTVTEIMKNMTIEEKIGQMFIVTLDQLETAGVPKNFPTAITSKQIANLEKYNVGGVIYFAKNVTTNEMLIKYNSDLQDNSKYPLFIAVDEEGGLVSRLGKNESINVTYFPSMSEIGASNNLSAALNVGETLGRELKALGFNLDFAPVADVFTNPENKVIGSRSFGSNKDLVGKMVTEVVKGLQNEDVSAAIKHFPGHGDTSLDTHTGAASVSHDKKRLDETELVPFKEGIKAGADFVLTAHILLPNVTEDDVPATMSKMILTDILRKELEFKKIIITDALDMGAITKYYKPDEVAIKCVLAGIDILLVPGDFDKAYNGLLKAVKDGTISEDRINESVKRILDVKLERGIIK